MRVIAGAAAAILFGITGTASARADLCASANACTFTVWNGAGVPDEADSSGASSLPFPPTAVFSYAGPLASINDAAPGSSDTFADFFGANASGISNFQSPTGGDLSDFLGTTMSTPSGNAGATTSFIQVTGLYTTSAPQSLTFYHADGASLYSGLGSPTTVFTSPSPTTGVVVSRGTLPAGSDEPFELLYVDTNGAPAVLSTTPPTSVPEPGSLGLLGTAVILLGLAGLGWNRSRIVPTQRTIR